MPVSNEKIDVKMLKELYPKPVQCSDKNEEAGDKYCVGGALCRYLANVKKKKKFAKHNFPGSYVLVDAICAVNKHITRSYANVLAFQLIRANDKRKFGKAWKYLNEALTHGQ